MFFMLTYVLCRITTTNISLVKHNFLLVFSKNKINHIYID